MNALTKYRDSVKERVEEGKGTILKLSDELRDDILPMLGIKLEDRGKGQPSIWKFEDKQVLRYEKLQKE